MVKMFTMLHLGILIWKGSSFFRGGMYRGPLTANDEMDGRGHC